MQKKAEQLEIFSSNNNYAHPKPREHRLSFLTRIRAYEKIILAVISLFIMGLISFSLGVERGKKISLRRIDSGHLDLAMMNRSEVLPQSEPVPAASQPQKIELPRNEKIQRVLLPVKQLAAVKPKANKPKTMPKQNIQTRQDKKAEQVQKTEINSSAYTIQVASFKAKNEALKEVESLKKRGLASIVLNKGSYLIVCVGNYSSKKQALISLEKLKKNYQDCLLRRL
ncbi:MAG: SPOR domain-containing protein [Candidatus Omnitrophica bacterium]|nr:SPOR domain-containing protein [Candidatus Omnitrophota bacterium]MDD5236909.1 SPOR domain-containing protein [Candidatus Omnitrophota bacterium]MDD5610380.1 SPOR domain-containing protein [Candidatus Omnitrophota bacterium]